MGYDNIPEELRERRQWVCWRSEARGDKVTKIPVNARSRSGQVAKTNDPSTWSTFARAVATAKRDGIGIGFVFTHDDPYFGIDIDGNHDDMGWNALDVIESFDTYTERSPSENGFHLIGRGTLPIEGSGKHPNGVGVFHHTRFFTMTGNVFSDRFEISDCQDAIDRWWETLFPPKPAPAAAPAGLWRPEDDEVLRRARGAANGASFIAMYDHGDTSTYSHNESEADLGLLSMLSFWTQDAAQLDRLFRGSAHYRDKDESHRSKWDRADYRRDTIATALQRSDFYTPPVNSGEGFQVYLGGKPISGDSAPVVAEDRDVDAETGEIVQKITVFNTTDRGNARRLVHHAGDRLRYVPKWGTWLVWDGMRWAPDELGSAWEVAKSVVDTIWDEVAAIPDEEKSRKMAGWAVQSESAARLRDMLRLAQSDPAIAVSPIDLDRDPMLLNVRNGTVDLRTGTLRPHRAEDMLTKLAPVDFDPAATCPRWDAFMSEIMARRDSLVDYLQRAAGYTLSGDVSERKMFICHGGGRNGKSTFLNTLYDLLGDYAKRSPNDLLIARHGDRGIPYDVAGLAGIRFTFVSETGEFDRLDENKVKDLVSSDTLSARFLHQNPFEMKPQFKLWAGTNHKPTIRSVDDAIWERTNLIPFTVKIPDDQVDRQLNHKLDAERSGILNWLIEGCLAWQMRGLEAPEIVRKETADYRASMDVVGSFLGEECVVREGSTESVSAMYLAYKSWADANGERPMTKKMFSMRMSERGHISRRTGRSNVHMYQGVRLRTVVDGDPSFMDGVDDLFRPEME